MAVSDPSPLFQVVRGSTGTAKSSEAVTQSRQLAREGRKVIYLARTVALADELAQRVGPAVSVRVWRGRDQENPDRPGQKMCREPDLVREARSLYADPNEVVCPICPHRETCAYLEQKAATAGIWFGASSLLWHEIPAVMKDAALLVIDESFALDGLKGIDGTKILIGVQDLERAPSHPSSVSRTADILAELMPRRRKLLAAFEAHPLGRIERDRLIDAGLTAADCADARKAEWGAKILIRKQMTFEELREALALARGNREVARRAMLWETLRELLDDGNAARSGRAELIEEIDKETGIAYRAIRLYGVSPIAKGWAELPTLHLDATANITLLRARVPHAELVADIVADEPHTHVIQYPTHAFGKRALTNNPKLLAEVWHSAISHAQSIGGKWLIVIQQAAEQIIREWETRGESIPPFVEIAHHNALAGIDRYRDVRGIIVIGRTVPPPSDVELIAGILTGYAVPACGNWYPAEMVTLKALDDSVVTVEHDIHPDPLADAVLRQICDDELMQIIGRGRGPNRTASDPLEIVIYGSVPVPVHELRVWSPPSLAEQLLAVAGVTLSNCGDMAEAFRLNPDTVKRDRRRENSQMGTNPYKRFLYGNVPICHFSAGELRGAVYRRDKPRHGEQRIVYDPRIVADPRAWLIDHLGPLAVFEPGPAAGSAPIPAEMPRAEIETSGTDLRHPVQVRRERDKARQMARRRAAGGVSRADYLAKNGLSKTKPWEQEGISRRTWERRRAQTTTGMTQPPSFVASPSEMTETASSQAPPAQLGRAAVPPPAAAQKAGGSVPVFLTKPIQLDFFTDYRADHEPEPLPEWNGGVAPPIIRQAIVRELRRRGARHEELADAIGLSRAQITNVLRGRFGTAPATANALRRLLGFWRSAA
jgi:putative DNA primase/helicase